MGGLTINLYWIIDDWQFIYIRFIFVLTVELHCLTCVDVRCFECDYATLLSAPNSTYRIASCKFSTFIPYTSLYIIFCPSHDNRDTLEAPILSSHIT